MVWRDEDKTIAKFFDDVCGKNQQKTALFYYFLIKSGIFIVTPEGTLSGFLISSRLYFTI